MLLHLLLYMFDVCKKKKKNALTKAFYSGLSEK